MKKLFLWFFVTIIFLTACTSATTENKFPTPLPPEPGKVTVTGRVFSITDGKPIPHISVHLAEVKNFDTSNSSPIFILNESDSPSAFTDPDGHFVIANVAPQEYVVVVGSINVLYAIVTETPDKAKVWKTAENQVLDIGDLRVELR